MKERERERQRKETDQQEASITRFDVFWPKNALQMQKMSGVTTSHDVFTIGPILITLHHVVFQTSLCLMQCNCLHQKWFVNSFLGNVIRSGV